MFDSPRKELGCIHICFPCGHASNTVELDSRTFDDSDYCTERFKEGPRVMSHTPQSLFLAPASCPFAPRVTGIFFLLLTHTSTQKSSFPLFYSEKISCCPQILPYTAKQKSQWSESAATFCSSSTLFRDLSSFQHIWMNKSQHRYYLGPNWSEPFFHFIHLFNKYLLMFVPGAGDTTVSKIDLLTLRSLGETWGDEWRQRFVWA